MSNIKATFKRLKGQSEKMGKKTIYLDNQIYKEFKKLCDQEGHSASEVINDMLTQAVEEMKSDIESRNDPDIDKRTDEWIHQAFYGKFNPDLLKILEALGEKAQLEILKNLKGEQKADEIEKAKSREYRRKG